MNFNDLLNEHAATSWDKQESLFRLMRGEHDWKLDLNAGVLALTNQRGTFELAIQWLGTAHPQDKKWVWSWNRPQGEVPSEVLEAAQAIRAFGETNGIPELTEPDVSLDKISGDFLALVAAGLCRADGYYVCETEQGAQYFLFQSEDVRAQGDSSQVRCMNAFLSVIPHIPLNHKIALSRFLTNKGYAIAESGSHLTATHPDGGELLVTFDDLNRLTEIKTKVPASTNASAQPAPTTRPIVEGPTG